MRSGGGSLAGEGGHRLDSAAAAAIIDETPTIDAPKPRPSTVSGDAMIRVRALHVTIVLALAMSGARPGAQSAEPPVRATLFQALAWRNIGPFRGGRATTVTGVPSQPNVYYMGATGGGVWKTDDSGLTW